MNKITPFRDRKIDRTVTVWVHRNLHRGGYSIVQNGLVVAHADRLMLSSVRFVVREAGRQRVLKTKVKNAHGFAVGWVVNSACGTDASGTLPVKIFYNPYKHGFFFTTGAIPRRDFRVDRAETLILNENGVSAAYIT